MSTEIVKNQPVIEVCYGPECSDLKGIELAESLAALGMNTCIGDCRNQCPNAPLAYVNNRMVVKATVQRVQDKIQALQQEAKI